MKNHRRLRNSPLLRLAIFAVLGLCLIPLLPSLATSHGAGGLAAAGLCGFTSLRFDAATDPANPDAVGIPDAIKAIEDKTLPMSQRLTVALKALQGVDPTGQLKDVKTQLDQAKTDLAARDAEITRLQTEAETMKKQITALETDAKTADTARALAEKEAAELRAKEQDLDKRAESKAKEKVAALGFPAPQLPKADEKITGASADEEIEALNKRASESKDPAEKGRLAQQAWDLMVKRSSSLN